MTRSALHKYLTHVLQGKVSHPNDDAALLTRRVCGVSANELLAHGEISLPLWRALWGYALAWRRGRHAPMGYLMGQRDFFGRSFFVNSSTLIPRPESECLVETALTLPRPDLIIDVGTGTGALGISLALAWNIPTIAVEPSRRACALARKNAKHLHAYTFSVRCGSYLKPLRDSDLSRVSHLLIVANLPYLSQRTWQSAPKEVRAFEPTRALLGGDNDGLGMYRELAKQFSSLLQKHPSVAQVSVLIELDPEQVATAQTLFPYPNRVIHDGYGHARGLLFSTHT